MPTTFIIDGYNLLHRAYRSLFEGHSLEEARKRLEHKLQAFQAAREPGTRLILVYDGASGVVAGSGGAGSRVKGDFQVRFARPPQEADDVILDICRRLERPADVEVVTSDEGDIARPLRGLGCRHQTSEAFAAQLERTLARHGPRRSSGSPGSAGKPAELSEQQVEQWLREFDMHPEKDET